MKGFYTILLLIVSNVFMTFAWYGHLKMKQEYSKKAIAQLNAITPISGRAANQLYSCFIFKGEALHWNHLAAFICLIAAVYFVFMK